MKILYDLYKLVTSQIKNLPIKMFLLRTDVCQYWTEYKLQLSQKAFIIEQKFHRRQCQAFRIKSQRLHIWFNFSDFTVIEINA